MLLIVARRWSCNWKPLESEWTSCLLFVRLKATVVHLSSGNININMRLLHQNVSKMTIELNRDGSDIVLDGLLFYSAQFDISSSSKSACFCCRSSLSLQTNTGIPPEDLRTRLHQPARYPSLLIQPELEQHLH